MTREAHASPRVSPDPAGLPQRNARSGFPLLVKPARTLLRQDVSAWIRRQVSYPVLHGLARRLLIFGFLLLILCADLISAWPVVQPSMAFALAFKNPNPTLTAPAWLTQTTSGKKPNLNKSAPDAKAAAATSSVASQQWPVNMKPAIVTLGLAAQTFVSSDGQLEVDLAAQSLDATQLAQAAGGIQLSVTQVKGAIRVHLLPSFTRVLLMSMMRTERRSSTLNAFMRPLAIHRIPGNNSYVIIPFSG